MRRILQKNRQSLFSVIPSEIIEDMNLKAGDELDFRIENEKIIAIPVHPHAFRHARATEDARCGYNEQLLKKKFGWAKGSKMVDRYVDLSDIDVQTADMNRMGNERIEPKKPELIEKAIPLSIDQAANRLFEIEEENQELKEQLKKQQEQSKKQQEENDFIMKALKAKGII